MTRTGSAARLWLLLLLGAVLLAFGVISFWLRIGATQPVFGVQWVDSSTGPIALVVEPDSIAWAAGLREGDRLLAVDGTPVPTALVANELGWSGESTAPSTWVVGRADVELAIDLEPEWSPRPEPYAYLSLVGLAFWVSGLFIALRWPGIRGGMVYTFLAFTLFAQLMLSHTGRADALDWSIYWTDLVAGALAPALLLHLGVALSRRALPRRGLYIGAAYTVALGLVLAAVWISPATLGGAYRFADPVRAVELRDRAETLSLALSLLLTVLLLVKSHARSSSVSYRGQVRWMLAGLAVGLGPFVMLSAVPWALGAPELPSWAQLLSVTPMLFVPAAFTAALARYRPQDVDVFLLRGISEVAAIFCAFAVYAAAVFLLREGLTELVPISRSGTRYLGLLGMALAYPQLRFWVRRGVERAFYRKRYSYRATLLDWAKDLGAETDLSSLLENLRQRIRDTLGVPEAEVLVWTGDRRFATLEAERPAELIELDTDSMAKLERESSITVEDIGQPAVSWARYLFSLNVKGSLRGLLALSERPHPEDPLSSEDRALVATLAAHAATAIEGARLVREVRSRADEIERLHARQAKILESSAVGLLLVDGDSRIQAWNRALEEIYGLARGDALGRRLDEVFPLHVVRRIERRSGAGPQPEDGRVFRLSLVNRGGERIIVNLAISPVDGDSDQDGARVVTFDDVSERVKLEEQVLRQERLASLGLLAAGVAHEINTPLTGISSYAQMLLDECARDDPRRPTLEKIEAQTRRAARITHSMLTLARPESTAIEAIDVNETIQEAVQLFEPQIRKRGIELRVDLAPTLPTLVGQRGKLQQVLLNLLINARDAVDRGGSISVGSRYNAGKILVDVVDDGVGIADEDLPSIFDPFFTTKGRGQGTGLGLSISYGIVREHHGEIHVESRPGEFTRFRVELPAVKPKLAQAGG
jgi:PAS domain S-box-containing protein